MSQVKLQAAKELIQEKRYYEARILLEATDHPTARAWLSKLPKTPNPKKQPRGNLILTVLHSLMICVVAFAGGLYLGKRSSVAVTTQDNQTIASAIASVSTLDSTSVAVSTISPTVTFTPLPTTDAQIATIRQNLEDYCVPPVRMVAIMNAHGDLPEGIFAKSGLDKIQNASDIETACGLWADKIVNSSLLDTAAYCRQKADAEFRDQTVFDCLWDRDFLASFFPDPSFGTKYEFDNFYAQMFNSAVMAGMYDNSLLSRYGYK